MRLISVTYGHGKSGKLYDYETDKQYRTGDTVVVPVTHYQSKKTYNTLATVMMTVDADSKRGKSHTDYLEGNRNKKGQFKRRVEIKDVDRRFDVARSQGLDVKNSHDVTVQTLPGYETRASNDNWSGNRREPEPSGGRLITRSAKRGE